jgi:dephospho-CoA kinase
VRVIGLTGNLGCGKSTVAAMFAARGAQVIDADLLVRELRRPAQPMYAAIVGEFGPGVLAADSAEIDPRRLAEIVFNDPDKLARLEAIVHPAVTHHIVDLLWQHGRAWQHHIVLIEAVKLVESDVVDLIEGLLIVTCRPQQQIERVTRARGWTEQQARARMAAQSSPEQKLARFIQKRGELPAALIDTSGTLGETARQVDELWSQLTAHPHAPAPSLS